MLIRVQKNMSKQNNENKKVYAIELRRHSLAHILAAAVLDMFPEAKFGVGPNIENGFYYDFELPRTLIPEDLPLLEAAMRKIINKNVPFERQEISHEEAVIHFNKANQNYKVEILATEAKDPQVTVYKTGNFVDLCRGPHIDSAGEIDATSFKLTKIAGAYWRGDEKKKMLQRIYGVAFQDKKELKEYFVQQEEAEKRDHRKIGAEQELFTFSPKIGSGLVLWLPKGNIIKEEIEKWAKETEEKLGYVRVTTPIITKEDLFYTSEHLPHYKESMYSPMDIDGENYYIKPMNCPFHHTIFSHRKRSYRELPMRLAEYGWCHRYEDSGSLFGLMRVRGMQMNDAHIYCAKEQAIKEFVDVIKLHQYYYDKLGIKDYYMELALRNPENKKYHGNDAMWKEAESLMREAMEISKVPYVVQNDGAAFYGPKIDFQIKSITGRIFTASTNQIDLFMPKKFDLKYIDKDGQEKFVVCIHRAPLGTHERFIGFLIEHFAGAFPTWLAPVQVRVVPISTDKHLDYAKKVYIDLVANGIRAELDEANDTLGKKIRIGEMQKIPYQLIVGDKEKVDNTVAIRKRGSKDSNVQKTENFIKIIKEEIENKKG